MKEGPVYRESVRVRLTKFILIEMESLGPNFGWCPNRHVREGTGVTVKVLTHNLDIQSD